MNAKIFWFTGLSGAGKTSIAESSKIELEMKGFSVLVLDGDVVRSNYHRDLSFTEEDIKENNHLISQICVENVNKYQAIIVPIISPYTESRNKARQMFGDNFFEVYCKTQIETLEDRDTKGLYAKSRAGKLNNLIGYSPGGVVYEPPIAPDITLDSDNNDLNTSVELFTKFVLNYIKINNTKI